uniref:Potassium channel n=1 Tax=Solanum lycopersicum TaxID=4081 RepID=A0A3Q7IRQ1_SOLLC
MIDDPKCIALSIALRSSIIWMLRLWRLRRVSFMFVELEKSNKLSYFGFVCVTLFAVHSAGCFYYFLAARINDISKTWLSLGNLHDRSIWSPYVMSMDWSVTTLTTTGYGDLHAVATEEMMGCYSSFAQKNNLPVRLEEQMLDHLSMMHRTDTVDKAYLFHGVSHDVLFQLVSEMKAEYFPPKEDIILQNEASTDLYILVNGAVDLISHRNGMDQAGDVCGEVGIVCCKPQLLTVRTKRISQLLRLDRTSFFNMVKEIQYKRYLISVLRNSTSLSLKY